MKLATGNNKISFGLTPCSKDVSIQLKASDAMVYELHAAYVNDVCYHKEKGRESLEIVISSEDSIWLRLKPHISIWQNCHPRL